ncbi:MAG TPA: hypothetical protein DCG75_12330 [Bacteroidales bacterium]|jgi:PAS domain S-box-containing protein|nr:hypothetical protein [Bacteroidales bacterium]
MLDETIYRYITEKATDIIYSVTLDRKIKFHNKAIEQIFETSVEEIEKNHYDHLMLPEDKKLAKRLHEERLNGKNSVFEHGFITPNGKLVYLECSANPIFDEDGQIVGSLGIARDITDRKKADKELKESKKQLEEIIESKDKFLSIIAHDLRDPFNTLIGYSDLILTQFESLSKEKIEKYVQAINSSSNKGFNLLQNLLDWSKAESGRITYTPEKVDISKTFDFIISSLEYSSAAKSISIKKNLDNSFIIVADENMLKTVLRNLISNAIKFSFKNSEILIDVIEEKLQYIINIIDSGIGISEENLSKIFSPDINFSQKGTKEERGTGLGLIICKEFVTKWGGRIWVESDYGKGSTFSFSIPKPKQ